MRGTLFTVSTITVPLTTPVAPPATPSTGSAVPSWLAIAWNGSGARGKPTFDGATGVTTRRNAGALNEAGSPCRASAACSVSGDVRIRVLAGPRNCTRRPGSIGCEAAADDRPEHGDRDLEPPLDGAHRGRIAELVPGGRDELLLLALDDDDAEPGDRARRRVEVQVAQPLGLAGVGGDGVARRLPAAVDGRRDDRRRRRGSRACAARCGRRAVGAGRVNGPGATSAPSSWSTPPSGSPNGCVPTRSGRRPTFAATGCGLSRRASVSKSPPLPVANSQW